MKLSVRRGLFETNSSSVHSITMCSKSDYDKWVNGELYFDIWSEKLVPNSDKIQENRKENEYDQQYLTHDEFFDYDYIPHEIFKETATTEHGDEIVAFGYYGFD